MRQHVNPLSHFFQLPLQLPPPEKLFHKPKQPIHLDIGCARGRCIIDLAQRKPEWNHLGLEIRRTLVEYADQEAIDQEHGNVRVMYCNANISLEGWMKALPIDLLQLVSIQFPDPWFKRRHRKRRILQPSLLLSIAKALQSGRKLFLQSDVLDVIQPMVKLIEMSKCFRNSSTNSKSWLQENPLIVRSEREKYVLKQNLEVYRALFIRNSQPLPALNTLEHQWKQIENPIKTVNPES